MLMINSRLIQTEKVTTIEKKERFIVVKQNIMKMVMLKMRAL
jgi:hypothetical protein